MKKNFVRLRTVASTVLRRYPLVVIAVVISLGLVGASLTYAHRTSNSTGQGFDTSRVLPQPVSNPTQSKVFTAETIKQYDGQSGHQCYVAVKGTVYEIKDSAYWKNGKHTPSDGRGYCGADMTSVISQSPHGEAILSSLPKVGVFQ